MKRIDPTGSCPAGEVSSWLHHTVRPGDALQVTIPFGDLVIDTDATTPLVLISAGIGATPMIGILEHLAANAPHRPTVVLHADRAPTNHPLRARLHELGTRLHNATVELWYQEESEDAHHGLLDLSQVALPADADIHVCGGTEFLQSVRAQLSAAGVPEERIHIEQFTPTDWRLGACPV